MADPLGGARLKISHAQKHLHALEKAIDTFSGHALDSVAQEMDPKTGESFFVLKELRHPDPELSLLIGDFLNNLRSALDHLAFQMVKSPVVPGGKPVPDRHIAFPICDDPDNFKAAKWKLGGAAPGAEAEIERLQPYPGRTSPFIFQPSRLSLLRDLNDWDKHRLLHVVENRLDLVGFLNPEWLASWFTREPGPFEAPAELARYKVRPGVDPEVDVGLYLATGVTFEGGPADGSTVTLLLAQMRYEVNAILDWLARFVSA